MKQIQNHIGKLNGLIIIGATALVGCTAGGNNPGIEYAPNMYVSEAYEAYTQTKEMRYNPHGMTMRTPVEGAVAMGQLAYSEYEEGYAESAAWTNPVAATEANVAEGGRLYDINCQHCHGKKGKNDGGVIKSGKYPPPPWDGYQSDQIKNLPDGQAFHSITFGKGNMGAHGNVLTPEERWKVLHYVRKLSLGDAFVYAPEGTADDLVQVKGKTFEGFELAEVAQADLDMVNAAMKHVKFADLKYKKFKDESAIHLDKVATYMNQHPELKAVVAGHIASDVKVPGLTENLSTVRAKTVCAYLEEKGISADRLTAKGMGSEMPITSNDTKEGKETNRRVEIYFVK
ncbi:MAG: OmpA family protein [Bacteroidia bacterium]|nr:OmpA family protein [Bacteroidia bacterium]